MALSRNGYIAHGVWVPEFILDQPDVLKELHYQFIHAGTDVTEAFQVLIWECCFNADCSLVTSCCLNADQRMIHAGSSRYIIIVLLQCMWLIPYNWLDNHLYCTVLHSSTTDEDGWQRG